MPELIAGAGPISGDYELQAVLTKFMTSIPNDIIDVGITQPDHDGIRLIKMSMSLHIDTELKPFDSGAVVLKKLLANARNMASALRVGASEIDKAQGAEEKPGAEDDGATEGAEAPEEVRSPNEPTDQGSSGLEGDSSVDGPVGPPR